MKLALKIKSDPGLAKQAFHTLTRVRLLTKFPHAGIVVGGMLMHSNLAKGLHVEPFDEASEEGWLLLDVGGNDARMQDLFDMHEGMPYDWFSLMAFLVPVNVRDSDRMYCYEWCWMAMTGEEPNFRVTAEMLLTKAFQMRFGSTV